MPARTGTKVLKPLRRLQRRSRGATRYLIDRLTDAIIPIPLSAGFLVSPEYCKHSRGNLGAIWSANEIPFQDRSAGSWPTLIIRIDRNLWPNFRVELCTIPANPVTVDGRALSRNEASGVHSLRLLHLRKGLSNSHWDQHFGARVFDWPKENTIDKDIAVGVALLQRVVRVDRADSFLENVVSELGTRHVYESWNEASPERPNKSY